MNKKIIILIAAIIVVFVLSVIVGFPYSGSEKLPQKSDLANNSAENLDSINNSTSTVDPKNINSTPSSAIRNGKIETATYTLDIPSTWKAADASQVVVSDIETRNATAIYKLDENCYAIFGAPTSLVPNQKDEQIVILEGKQFPVSAYTIGGGTQEHPWPERQVNVLKLSSDVAGNIIYNSTISSDFKDWHRNLKCHDDFFAALSRNLKFISSPSASTLQDFKGGTLTLKSVSQGYSTTAQQNSLVFIASNGSKNFVLPTDSLNLLTTGFDTANYPTIYGSGLYYLNKDKYLERYDLWSGSASIVPLVTQMVQRKDIAIGHEPLISFYPYKNKIWYLGSEQPCNLNTAPSNTCNTELRSFDLSTKMDVVIKRLQAGKIVFIDPSENALYAEGYRGENNECISNKGGIVKLDLNTGSLNVLVKGICNSNEIESHTDINKRNSIVKKMSLFISMTDTFSIGDSVLSPLAPSAPILPYTIRFVSN
ncbi:MAG: hypothetical protein WAW92_01780 [Minisyncoccia bacterium]